MRTYCRSIGCTTQVEDEHDFCADCAALHSPATKSSDNATDTEAKPLSFYTGKLPERDPHGRDQHTPGAKVDAGKPRPGLVLGGFARALMAVTEIGTFGAAKYTENGWMVVPNAQARYDDAQLRHWLYEKMGTPLDPDTQKTHLAHEAWNALAKLDLHLREQEKLKAGAAVTTD